MIRRQPALPGFRAPLRLGLAAAVALFMSLLVPSGMAAQAPTVLTMGVTTHSAFEWPFFVGIDEGFYKSAGIDLQLLVTDTNTKAIQALLSGSLDMADASPDPLIKAVAETGADLVIIGSAVNRPAYSFIVQPDIKTYQDLKGKRVGVSAILSMDGLWMGQLLRAHGLKEGDTEIVEIGGGGARYLALKSRGVAGTLLAQPQDLRALREGFRRLGLSTEIVKEIVWSPYMVTRVWAKQHEDRVLRFLATQRRILGWIYDPKNRAEAIRVLAKWTNTDQVDAQQTYDLWISQKVLSREGETTTAAVKAIIDALVATKQLKEPVPVDRVLDLSYLEKVRRGAGK